MALHPFQRWRLGSPRRIAAGLIALGLIFLQVPVFSASAMEGWKVLPPWRSPGKTGMPVIFAKALSQELKVPVALDESVGHTHEAVLAWSLAQAPHTPSLVILSDELVLRDSEKDSSHPRNLAHYEPLIMIWQTRWCLFAKANSELQSPTALGALLQQKSRPPVIAIPEKQGRMSVWVNGLAQRTQQNWKVVAYGLRGNMVDALNQGADIAVGYCSRQATQQGQTRILLQSGNVRSADMPYIPLTTDMNWPPLDHGWIAWAAPKTVPQVQRQAMEQALYRVMGQPDVQTHLKRSSHIAVRWTPAESRKYIASFTQSWTAVSKLLSIELGGTQPSHSLH